MSELSTDWWLAEAHTLKMPKREIGDYVESQGFNVPRRFETLEEAAAIMRQGGKIILRSEHPEEYDGPSGLATSHVIDLATCEEGLRHYDAVGQFSIDEAIQAMASSFREVQPSPRDKSLTHPGQAATRGGLTAIALGHTLRSPGEVTTNRLLRLAEQEFSVRRYASLTNRSSEEFMREAGFSFWEYTSGTNVTVIADDAIDGRYHIFGAPDQERERDVAGWHITDSHGESIRQNDRYGVLTPDHNQSLIATYEAIRRLPRFAAEHCPIMEFQLDPEGTVWFLQYHRSRDYRAAAERLNPADFPATEGWHKSSEVRGVLESPTTIEAVTTYPQSFKLDDFPTDTKRAAIEVFTIDRTLGELLARRHTGFVTSSRDGKYLDIAIDHKSRSEWFKPRVAMAQTAISEIIGMEKLTTMRRVADRLDILCTTHIEMASDGHTGYIRSVKDTTQSI